MSAPVQRHDATRPTHRAIVDRRPTSADVRPAADRTPVSLASAIAAKFAARAAIDPPLDPAVTRLVSRVAGVAGRIELTVSIGLNANRHVRLGDHHGAGVASRLNASLPVLIVFSDRIPPSSACRRFVVVLDEHRHAVHRPDRTRLAEAAIEIVGGLQRVGIDHHDRVQPGALLVVGAALQILFDERSGRSAIRAKRRLDLCDGGFLVPEGRRLCTEGRDGEAAG
jgi:hypothetical protein